MSDQDASVHELPAEQDLSVELERLRAENAELRKGLLRWREAAISKWAEVAEGAISAAGQVDDLRRQLAVCEADRLDIGAKHHLLSQQHHELHLRNIELEARRARLTQLADRASAKVRRAVQH